MISKCFIQMFMCRKCKKEGAGINEYYTGGGLFNKLL